MTVICKLKWRNNGLQEVQTWCCLTGLQLPTGTQHWSITPGSIGLSVPHCFLGKCHFLSICCIFTTIVLRTRSGKL